MFEQLFTVPGLLGFGGGLLGSYGSYQAGQYSQAAYEKEAELALRNAEISRQMGMWARQMGAIEQRQQLKMGEQYKGETFAKLSASGAVTGEGAPLAVMMETEAELALENAMIGYEALLSQARYESEAQQYELMSEIAHERGKAAAEVGEIEAGKGLFETIGDLF